MYGDFSGISKLPSNQFEEMRKYGEERANNLKASVLIPSTLHHYTDATGFKGIIENGVLWATHIGFMNDGNEYMKGVTSLLNAVGDLIFGTKDYPPEADSVLRDLWWRLRQTTADSFPPVFISCFTELRNNLNQWRAYSKGDGGFSIGFNAITINDFADKTMQGAELFPVIYDDSKLNLLISEFIQWIITNFPKHSANRGGMSEKDHRNCWLDAISAITAVFGVMFKDEEFSEEREHRIVWFHPQKTAKFNARVNILSPYCEIKFTSEASPLMPITEVWAGPGRYTPLNATSARGMLDQKGYDLNTLKIEQSSIRYRVG